MKKKLLFIRTFKPLKGGGPVPPLGILYLASVIRRDMGDRFDVRIIDLGIAGAAAARDAINEYDPDYIGLGAMSCEADLMHDLAATAKRHRRDTVVIAGGPHATVAKERLLDDANIDVAVAGEAERTIAELLESLENGGDLSIVKGIAFRSGAEVVYTGDRHFIEDLDELPFPAWDLVNIKEYSAHPNWSGVLKEDSYAVIASSRGCPYGCFFCHNIFGKKVRMRTPESVVEEMRRLNREYGVKEFHFVDDVFNYDVERAAGICRLIIEGGPRLALAFPNGLRADIMTGELVSLLKKAGAYKIHYGFETTSPELQKKIGKNLDIPAAVRAFEATSGAGIVTGAYFMFGLPGQDRRSIMETIDFAANSCLDVAYFFKATPYPGSRLYDSLGEQPVNFSDYHFYSVGRAHGELDETELNNLILLAQRRFFLRPGRFLRGFIKTPRKSVYIKNTLALIALIIQSLIFQKLAERIAEKKKSEERNISA